MKFLNEKHENQLVALLQGDGTHPKDVERISLFYILSGNTDLYAKFRHIYDFMNHEIVPDYLHDGGAEIVTV